MAVMDKIDSFVREAGGKSLANDGVFNNAYVLATADSAAARARIAEFNEAFTAWYGEVCRSIHHCTLSSVGSWCSLARLLVLYGSSSSEFPAHKRGAPYKICS